MYTLSSSQPNAAEDTLTREYPNRLTATISTSCVKVRMNQGSRAQETTV